MYSNTILNTRNKKKNNNNRIRLLHIMFLNIFCNLFFNVFFFSDKKCIRVYQLLYTDLSIYWPVQIFQFFQNSRRSTVIKCKCINYIDKDSIIRTWIIINVHAGASFEGFRLYTLAALIFKNFFFWNEYSARLQFRDCAVDRNILDTYSGHLYQGVTSFYISP